MVSVSGTKNNDWSNGYTVSKGFYKRKYTLSGSYYDFNDTYNLAGTASLFDRLYLTASYTFDHYDSLFTTQSLKLTDNVSMYSSERYTEGGNWQIYTGINITFETGQQYTPQPEHKTIIWQ